MNVLSRFYVAVTDFSYDHSKQHCCYKCSNAYLASVGACPCCYPRGDCENTSCNNMKYCDLVYGLFSYCSPSCRDQHLLPEYNKKLREHLESTTVCNSKPAGVKMEGYSESHTITAANVGSPPSHDQQLLKHSLNTSSTPATISKDVATGTSSSSATAAAVCGKHP